jgi:hypothetical protein
MRTPSVTAAASVAAVGAGVAEAPPTGITDPSATVVVTVAQGVVGAAEVVEVTAAVLSTVVVEATLEEEAEDGGKPHHRCRSSQTLGPHELNPPASSNKFPLSLITSQFSSARFPGLCALLS